MINKEEENQDFSYKMTLNTKLPMMRNNHKNETLQTLNPTISRKYTTGNAERWKYQPTKVHLHFLLHDAGGCYRVPQACNIWKNSLRLPFPLLQTNADDHLHGTFDPCFLYSCNHPKYIIK